MARRRISDRYFGKFGYDSLNAVLLMVVSSTLGPVLTDLFGRRLAPVQPPLPEPVDMIPIPSQAAALASNADKGDAYHGS
jgi:hypothetical protein